MPRSDNRSDNHSLPIALASLVMGVLALSGCTTFTEPTETVTGTYLSGRLAARTNDTQTAADQYARVHAIAPGNKKLLFDTFLYRLLSGEFDDGVISAKRLARTASIQSVDSASQPLGGAVDPLIAITLSVDDIRAGRYSSARKNLSLVDDKSLYRSLVFLLQGWAIAGEEGDVAAGAFLNNPGPTMFTGFSPLHLAMLAENAGDDKDARSGYQLSFFTLGGPVGRRKFAEYLLYTDDKAAARETNQLLLQQRGPMYRVGLRNLQRLDSGKINRTKPKTTPQEGAAIALYTFGAAIAEQIFNQRESAQEAGFSLRDPDLSQPLLMSQLAVALDPDLDEALRFIGTLNNINEQHESAIASLSKISPSSAYYEQAQIEIANAYLALEKPERSIQVLETLIAKDNNADEARLILAANFARLDEHQKAVDVLNPAIAILEENTYPDRWRFYVSRADSLLKLDRWQEAEADLEKSVELAPDEPTTLNFLGYSWAERGVNLDKAFELLQQAVEKEPRSGAIIDSVGWAYFQTGDYQKAVENLEKAVSIEPTDPTLTDHLGDVYWKLDRKIEARYEWRRALDLDPGPKLKRELARKLKDGLAPNGQ